MIKSYLEQEMCDYDNILEQLDYGIGLYDNPYDLIDDNRSVILAEICEKLKSSDTMTHDPKTHIYSYFISCIQNADNEKKRKIFEKSIGTKIDNIMIMNSAIDLKVYFEVYFEKQSPHTGFRSSIRRGNIYNQIPYMSTYTHELELYHMFKVISIGYLLLTEDGNIDTEDSTDDSEDAFIEKLKAKSNEYINTCYHKIIRLTKRIESSAKPIVRKITNDMFNKIGYVKLGECINILELFLIEYYSRNINKMTKLLDIDTNMETRTRLFEICLF
jgi:hypothetical protein